MAGIRFILLNIFVTCVVSLILLALGLWWFKLSYVPSLLEQVAQRAAVADSVPLPVADENTIPSVVAESLPAVVSIVVTAEVPLYEQYIEEFNPFGGWGGFTIPRQRQIGTEEREIGGGTGFFVSADGYLITNRHVVEQSNVAYTAVLNDGRTYPVTVIDRDPMLDIAVLKVDDASETFAHLSLSEMTDVQLGEPVIAIGNALAEFPNSVSVGVVSGLSRNIVARSGLGQELLEGLIQTDAAINQGNSGGPLLNTAGDVIGINVAMAGGSENIGFALPAPAVAHVFSSVRENGEIIRPFLGVRYLQIDDTIAERNSLPVAYGVLVVRGESRTDMAVIPDSPADRAGIVENDIILAIDEVQLDGSRSLASLLRQYEPDDTITLTLWRDGQEETVTVTLGSLPD